MLGIGREDEISRDTRDLEKTSIFLMLFTEVELVPYFWEDVLEMPWVIADLFIAFFDICISMCVEPESSYPGPEKSRRNPNCIDFYLC